MLRSIYEHVIFLAVMACALALAYGFMELPRTVYEAVK